MHLRFSSRRRRRFPRALATGGAAVLLWFLALPAYSQSSRRQRSSPSNDETAASPTPATTQRTRKKPSVSATDNEPTASPTPTPATRTEGPRTSGSGGAAAVSSLKPEELADFDKQPAAVRKLLTAALELTGRNLSYTYGSADPSAGGMDCSGTIYYLLRAAGFDDVPRQANEQYLWVRQRATFYAVLSKASDNVELREMRPGDLLFWTGTYKIDRDPPVTHTMIYLGRRKRDGKPLMFGASDGRSYDGQRRNGVSVFDFKLPAARSGDTADANTAAAPDRAPDFAGYGPIPGFADLNSAEVRRSSGGGTNDSPSSSRAAGSGKPTRRERE